MKAIQVPRVGGVEVLTLVDIPAPSPKPNEVVIKIAAAGVNFIDVYFREGRYPVTSAFHYWPGSRRHGERSGERR